MPLQGTYLPSTSEWARTQAERYEASGGAEANTLRGVPIIVLTTVGAKTGALRKTALMRVDHDGRYAVVASRGGAPEAPQWYWNLRKQPARRAAGRRAQARLRGARALRRRALRVVGSLCRRVARLREYQKKTDRLIAVFLLEPVEG